MSRMESRALEFVRECGLGKAFLVWWSQQDELLMKNEVDELVDMNNFDPTMDSSHELVWEILQKEAKRSAVRWRS